MMDNDTYDEIMRRLERVELDFANLAKVQRDVLYEVKSAHLADLRENRLIVARLERHIKNLEKSKRDGLATANQNIVELGDRLTAIEKPTKGV